MRQQKGFTLVELLVVMGIAVILSIIVVAVSLDKIKEAGDTVVEQDISQYGGASESYATNHSGFYPSSLMDLFNVNEISKQPSPPEGYSYTYTAYPTGCTSGISCTSVTITSQLKSVLHVSAPFVRYESTSGKTCEIANPATSCP